MEIKRLGLVLADISGYTNFIKMHTMSLLHAEMIITELLEAVIAHADVPLTLNKLEGDAALFYAALGDNEEVAAQDVLRQVVTFFEAFTERERAIIGCNSCMCDACRNIEKLRLKVVVHCGAVATKQIRQFEELAGEDVILIHRLLKNSISAKEYIILTEQFFALAGGITGETPETRQENAEGIGAVNVKVYYPVVDKTFPHQPAPNFPAPESDFRAIADRWNNYARRRIQGQDARPNFSSLPNEKMTLWNWIDYFVLSDLLSTLYIQWRRLTKKD